jgi:O-acetyl-ADP-ribose deacetylase (regulator of RNase III)
MIEFTKGDMFDVPVNVRVNTVNCKGVMGAGIALAFKNRYPDMFEDYQEACREGRVRPGTLHVWKSPVGDCIINFPTKRDWRDPSRYEDILAGLDALRNYLRQEGPVSVALPALGCGHGGLDWRKVAPMIEDSLGDLDAHIFVFEPADSRKAGQTSQNQPTEEQMKALEALGFKVSELSVEGVPTTILAKGDLALLARRWIALLPSKDPTEREIAALNAVASQMVLSSRSVTIALAHATRATKRVADLFLNHGIAVVLILPFGPLSRKTLARTPTDNHHASFVMVSVAAPAAAWSRVILAQSMKLLRSGASSVLLSDPTPDWLNNKSVRAWTEHPVSYLRYDSSPDAVRQMLDRAGARPIGRRPDTGQPNLAPLFSDSSPSKRGAGETLVGGQNQFSIPLTAASAGQLRDLAEAITQSPHLDGKVYIMIPCGPETQDLCAVFRRILAGNGTDAKTPEE